MPPIVLDGTTGITTPGLTNTGTETLVNLTTTGNTILGDASTDTLNVGNGGLVKDSSGRVGIGQGTPAYLLDVNGTMRLGSAGSIQPLLLRSSVTGGLLVNNTASGGAGPLIVQDNGTEVLRVTDSLVVLKGGSTSATGVGITFPATQSASTDANTLDDYEEGTWSPTWSVSGGTINTPAYANGTYTKIGNTVYIRGYISYGGTVTGTPSGSISIGGLPFTPGNGFGQSSTFAGGVTAIAASFWVSNPPSFAQITPGSTTTSGMGYRTSTGGAAVQYSDMDRGATNYSQFIFQGQYTV